VGALVLSGDISSDSAANNSKTDEAIFPGLGIAGAESDWPGGMFVAGAIVSTDHLPRPVRISGVFHSIRPALFSTARDGRRRKRLLMLGLLVASLMPSQIRAAMRWMWRAIFARRSSK